MSGMMREKAAGERRCPAILGAETMRRGRVAICILNNVAVLTRAKVGGGWGLYSFVFVALS
jgi:hypothetical protein